jgi:hypothetical protein
MIIYCRTTNIPHQNKKQVQTRGIQDNASPFYKGGYSISFYISAGKRENTQLPTKYRKDINSFGIVTYIMKKY